MFPILLMIKRPKAGFWIIVVVILTATYNCLAKTKPQVFQHGTSQIVSVHFAPDGTKFVSADLKGTVKMWDVQSGKMIWSVNFTRPTSMGDYTYIDIRGMDLSPDGKTIAVAYLRHGVDRNIVDEKLGDTMKQRDVVYEPHIVLLKSADGSIERDIKDTDKIFHSISFSPNGMFSVSKTEILKIEVDIQSGRSKTSSSYVLMGLDMEAGQISEIIKLNEATTEVVFSPNQKFFTVTGYRLSSNTISVGIVELYDTSTEHLIRTITQPVNQVPIVSFSPDDKFLSIAGWIKSGTRIDIWDTAKQVIVKSIVDKPETTITETLYLKDGHLLLGGGKLELKGFGDVGDPILKDRGGVVRIYDLNSNARPVTHKFKSYVTSISHSFDKSQLAVGMYNGQITILRSS
jgi:WD40 repeat protein